MPIYEYRCRSCEKTFEVIQRFGDRQLRKCEECSGRLDKLLSRAAFHLKGGGWYAEGYHKGEAKKSGDAGQKTDKKKGSSATSGSKSATGGTGD